MRYFNIYWIHRHKMCFTHSFPFWDILCHAFKRQKCCMCLVCIMHIVAIYHNSSSACTVGVRLLLMCLSCKFDCFLASGPLHLGYYLISCKRASEQSQEWKWRQLGKCNVVKGIFMASYKYNNKIILMRSVLYYRVYLQ